MLRNDLRKRGTSIAHELNTPTREKRQRGKQREKIQEEMKAERDT